MPCRTHLLLLFSLFTPAVGFRSIAIDLYADDAACSSKDQRRRVLLDTCYKAAHIGLAGGKDALSMLVAASRFDAVDSTAWTTPAVIESWLAGMEVKFVDSGSPSSWYPERKESMGYNLTMSWYPPTSNCVDGTEFATGTMPVRPRVLIPSIDKIFDALEGIVESDQCVPLLPIGQQCGFTLKRPLAGGDIQVCASGTDLLQPYWGVNSNRRTAKLDNIATAFNKHGSLASVKERRFFPNPAGSDLANPFPGFLGNSLNPYGFDFFNFCFDGKFASVISQLGEDKRSDDERLQLTPSIGPTEERAHALDILNEVCDELYSPFRAVIRQSSRLGNASYGINTIGAASAAQPGWMADERSAWPTFVRVAREVVPEFHAVALRTDAHTDVACNSAAVESVLWPAGETCTSAMHGSGKLAQWWEGLQQNDEDDGDGRQEMPSTSQSYVGYSRSCANPATDTVGFDVYHDGSCEATSFAPSTQVIINASTSCTVAWMYHPAITSFYQKICALPFGGLSEWRLRLSMNDRGNPLISYREQCIASPDYASIHDMKNEVAKVDDFAVVKVETTATAEDGAPSCGMGEYVTYTDVAITLEKAAAMATCTACPVGYACRGSAIKLSPSASALVAIRNRSAIVDIDVSDVVTNGIYRQSSAVCHGEHQFHRGSHASLVRIANTEVNAPQALISKATYAWILGTLGANSGGVLPAACSLPEGKGAYHVLNSATTAFLSFTDARIPVGVGGFWQQWSGVAGKMCRKQLGIGGNTIIFNPEDLFTKDRLDTPNLAQSYRDQVHLHCWKALLHPTEKIITTRQLATKRSCGDGQFSPSKGSLICTTCPAGRYSEGDVATECLPCPIGFKCAPKRHIRMRRSGFLDRTFRAAMQACNERPLYYETYVNQSDAHGKGEGSERIHRILASKAVTGGAQAEAATRVDYQTWMILNVSDYCLVVKEMDVTSEIPLIEIDEVCRAASAFDWNALLRVKSDGGDSSPTAPTPWVLSNILSPVCASDDSFLDRIELFTLEDAEDALSIDPDAMWWTPGRTRWTPGPNGWLMETNGTLTLEEVMIGSIPENIEGDAMRFAVDAEQMKVVCTGATSLCAVESSFVEALVPDGSYRENASSALACEPGFYCQGGVRMPCPSGWYAAASSSAECQRCEEGSFSTINVRTGTASCDSCPLHGVKCGGINELGASIVPGYWFDENDDSDDDADTGSVSTRRRLEGGVDEANGRSTTKKEGLLLRTTTVLYECKDEVALCGTTRVANSTEPRFRVACGGGRVGVKCQLCSAGSVRTKSGCSQCDEMQQKNAVIIIITMLAGVVICLALLTAVVALRPMKQTRLDSMVYPVVVAKIYGRKWRKIAALRKNQRDAGQDASMLVPAGTRTAAITAAPTVRMQGGTGALEVDSVASHTDGEEAVGRLAQSEDATGDAAGRAKAGVDALRNAANSAGDYKDTVSTTSGTNSACSADAMTSITRNCVSIAMLKTALGNVQITASLPLVFDVSWPPAFTGMLSAIGVAMLDFAALLADAVPCAGATHYQSLVVLLSMPILCVVAAAPVYAVVAVGSCVLKGRKESESIGGAEEKGKGEGGKTVTRTKKRCTCAWVEVEKVARANIVKLNLIVTMLLFPAICNRIFTTFKCEKVGDTYFLVADWRKKCFQDSDWLFFSGLALCGAIVYIVALPIGITLALLHHHRRARLRYPQLEILEPRAIAHTIAESRKHFRVRLKYGDLYWVYRQQFWWFEAPQILRKLILTGAIALVPGAAEQLLLGVLVSIAYALLVCLARPYAAPADNRVAIFDAIAVLLTLLLGLYVEQRVALSAMKESASASVSSSSATETERDWNAVACDVALVCLNIVVVVAAVIQQPPFVSCYNTLVEKCPCKKHRKKTAQPQLLVNELERSGGESSGESSTAGSFAFCVNPVVRVRIEGGDDVMRVTVPTSNVRVKEGGGPAKKKVVSDGMSGDGEVEMTTMALPVGGGGGGDSGRWIRTGATFNPDAQYDAATDSDY